MVKIIEHEVRATVSLSSKLTKDEAIALEDFFGQAIDKWSRKTRKTFYAKVESLVKLNLDK